MQALPILHMRDTDFSPIIGERERGYLDQLWKIVCRIEQSHPVFSGVVQQIKIEKHGSFPNTWPKAAGKIEGQLTLIIAPMILELYTLLDQHDANNIPTLNTNERVEAEAAWDKYIPSSPEGDFMAFQKKCEHIDGRIQALMTFLFLERYPNAEFNQVTPNQIADTLYKEKISILDCQKRYLAGSITYWHLPNKNALDAEILHEMTHLKDHFVDQKQLAEVFASLNPEITSRYPQIANNQLPHITRTPLLFTPIILTSSMLLEATLTSRAIFAGLCLYFHHGYDRARSTIMQDMKEETYHAFCEWKEREADLGVITHGTDEEIAAYRAELEHRKTEKTFMHILINESLAMQPWWKKLLSPITATDRKIQYAIYYTTTGRLPFPQEMPGWSFQHNYSAYWARKDHIESQKRLDVYDANVTLKSRDS